MAHCNSIINKFGMRKYTTTVLSLTDKTFKAVYTLHPRVAVCCAYYQFHMKNNNDWQYSYEDAKETKFGYLCGEFWAKKN